MKKVLSLVLALTLALALAIPAGAADLGVIGGADGLTSIVVSGGFDTSAFLKQQRTEALKALGGVEGQTNVLLGSKCIAFTDAAPEAKNGRTMVPLRATLEAMDAQVDYDNAAHAAVVTLGDKSFTHVIGSDVIDFSDGTQLKMDVASYGTPSGRTMVPVRFFSQVLGYDVFWDNDYKLVFLLDKDTFIEDVDAHFSVLNDFLAKSAKSFDVSKNYREDVDLSGTVKLLDSINGDRSFNYSGKITALLGRDGMTMTLSADLSRLLELLESTLGSQLPVGYREALAKPEFSAIFGDRLYLKSPLLDALMTTADSESAASGAWYAMDAGTSFSALYQAMYGGDSQFTVGSLLYAAMAQGDANHFYAAWSGAVSSAAMLQALYADELFTRSGSTYRCHIGTDTLAAAMNAAAGQELYTADALKAMGIENCSIDLAVRNNGSAEAKCVLDVASDGESLLRINYTASSSGTGAAFKGSVQVRNLCDVTFNASASVRTTKEAVSAAPAVGETVIELTGAAAQLGG